jgi:hypothetical protein
MLVCVLSDLNLLGSWLCMALVIGYSLLGLNLINFCFVCFSVFLYISSSLYCFTVNLYLYLVIFNIIFLFLGKINIYYDLINHNFCYLITMFFSAEFFYTIHTWFMIIKSRLLLLTISILYADIYQKSMLHLFSKLNI